MDIASKHGVTPAQVKYFWSVNESLEDQNQANQAQFPDVLVDKYNLYLSTT